MPELVNLKDRGLKDQAYENEKLAEFFEEAARRARRGEFKSACWIAWGREEEALFGWQKFGSIIPLIGAVTTTLRDMGDSPHMHLNPLEDPPEDSA